ncbi:MAG: dethiobiotin synthase, partial [Planctomycetota bacterium]|nr:dethiobiotin synthase [Planctomycetota bacterium]
MSTAALRCVISGTDTDVGKTHVTRLLAQGLRALGRTVWLHKPVACGGWDGETAEDARDLADLVSDGQDPNSLCRHQWPEPCSPHLAAALAGDHVESTQLLAEATALLQPGHDCLIEAAGGLLSPMSADLSSALDMALALELPLLIVTRPHLGTLNHTA